MKRQEPVLDLSCRGRHPKTVHEEVPMDSLFEIARVVLVAIAHGVTLGVLARRREGDGSGQEHGLPAAGRTDSLHERQQGLRR